MALTKTPIELSSTPGIVDNSNATAITIDASENVGIGGAPASLLDVSSTGEVVSTVRSTSTSGARQATLRLNVPSTGGDDPAGRVQFTYGTGYTVAGSIEMSHTNSAMKFLSGTTEAMRISGSNVGIGVSPQARLHVDGAEDYTGGIVLTAGAQLHSWFLSSDVVNVHNIHTSSAAAAHTWQTNGTEKVRITPNGLTFNGDTAAANALDDYEEGTWTMGLNTNVGNATIVTGNTTGYYTKVGNLVTVGIYNSGSNVSGAGTGTPRITGLPFPVAQANGYYTAASFSHTDIFSTTYSAYGAIGNTFAQITQVGSTAGAAFNVGNPRYLMFSLTYFTSA
jgi:hypothetical protein